MSLEIGSAGDGKINVPSRKDINVGTEVESAIQRIQTETATYGDAITLLESYLDKGYITEDQLKALIGGSKDAAANAKKIAEAVKAFKAIRDKFTAETSPQNLNKVFGILILMKEGKNPESRANAIINLFESSGYLKDDKTIDPEMITSLEVEAKLADMEVILADSKLGFKSVKDLEEFVIGNIESSWEHLDGSPKYQLPGSSSPGSLSLGSPGTGFSLKIKILGKDYKVTTERLRKAVDLLAWLNTQQIGVEVERAQMAVYLAFMFPDKDAKAIQAMPKVLALSSAADKATLTLAQVKGKVEAEGVSDVVDVAPSGDKTTADQVSAELDSQGILAGEANKADREKLAELLLRGNELKKPADIVTEFIGIITKLNSSLPEGKRVAIAEIKTKIPKLLIGKEKDSDLGDLNATVLGEMKALGIINQGGSPEVTTVNLQNIKDYIQTKAILAELNKEPKVGSNAERPKIAIALAKKYPDKPAAEIITELKRVITERESKKDPKPADINAAVNAQLAALQLSGLEGVTKDMFPEPRVDDKAPEGTGDAKVHSVDKVPDVTHAQVNESFAVNFLGLTPKEYAELTDKSWRGVLAKLREKMIAGRFITDKDRITWEAFNAYISDSKSSVLLVNRMNQTAFKEFFGNFMEENDDVPGMLRMMHRVNYTTLKKAKAMDLLKAYLVDAQGYVSYDSESMAQGISREIGKTQCPRGLDTAKFEQFKKFISWDSSVKDFSLADFMEVLTKLGAKKEQIEPILTTIAQFDADKSTISYEEFKMLLTKIASDLKLKPDDAGVVGKREADVVALYKFLTGEKTAPKADEQGDTVTGAEYDDFSKIKAKYESLQDPIAQANYLLEVMEKTTKDDIRNNVAVSIYAGYVELYLLSGSLPQGVDSDKASGILTKFEALLKSKGISSLTMERANPSDSTKTVKVEVKVSDILPKIAQAKEKLAEMKKAMSFQAKLDFEKADKSTPSKLFDALEAYYPKLKEKIMDLTEPAQIKILGSEFIQFAVLTADYEGLMGFLSKLPEGTLRQDMAKQAMKTLLATFIKAGYENKGQYFGNMEALSYMYKIHKGFGIPISDDTRINGLLITSGKKIGPADLAKLRWKTQAFVIAEEKSKEKGADALYLRTHAIFLFKKYAGKEYQAFWREHNKEFKRNTHKIDVDLEGVKAEVDGLSSST